MSGLFCEAAAHLLREELLVDLAVVHFLLNGAAGDEAVHRDLPPLSDAPGALPRLHVCRGVPVRVIQQHPAGPTAGSAEQGLKCL